MATSTGTSTFAFQTLLSFPGADAWCAIAFNGAIKPPQTQYVGWGRIQRFNGQAWVEVATRAIYGEGVWIPNVSLAGTCRLVANWRVPGYVWTAYSGPFS